MKSIRTVTNADFREMLTIYTPYIQNTSITFETEVPAEADFNNRVNSYLINWPWLVCEVEGVIAGYAYASRYRERVAYQWSVECSVYVHDYYQRAGVARALYATLFEILKRQGFRNVYAVINLPNDKSVAFHESCGFKHFATYEQVGYKLGQWKNVGWWRLIINDFGDDPPAPVPFSKMNKDFLPSAFEKATLLLKV
jgi:phosphinothricin acetyltransferase